MATLKIDKAEARGDGPWIRSEGHWASLACHGIYVEHGYVPIELSGDIENCDYWNQFKIDWPGDEKAGSAPGRFTGTRDPIAVEIARQWRAILDAKDGMVPKLGPIGLEPVKVFSEPYQRGRRPGE